MRLLQAHQRQRESGVQKSAKEEKRVAVRAKCGGRTTFQVPTASQISVPSAAADQVSTAS